MRRNTAIAYYALQQHLIALTGLLQAFKQTLAPRQGIGGLYAQADLVFWLDADRLRLPDRLASAVVFWRLKKKFA